MNQRLETTSGLTTVTDQMPKLKYNEIEARIVADSFYINHLTGEPHRLISLEGTMARYVLAELNTHRMLSRNSASSRAIPTLKQIRRILENPYKPLEWGKNKPGMSASEVLNPEEQELAEDVWQENVNHAVIGAITLNGGLEAVKDPELKTLLSEEILRLTGRTAEIPQTHVSESGVETKVEPFVVHKQIVNRLMEFAMYHTVLITSTDWNNFFALRISEHAQPDLRAFAEKALEAIEDSTPRELGEHEWHMPYVDLSARRYEDYDTETLKKVAVARSARLSYLNQEKHLETGALAKDKMREELSQKARDLGISVSDIPGDIIKEIEDSVWNEVVDKFIKADIGLHDNLVASGHMSPLEHVAHPFSTQDWEDINSAKSMLPENHFLLEGLEHHGNFRGWHQYRKYVQFEGDFSHRTESKLIDQQRIQQALGGFALTVN